MGKYFKKEKKIKPSSISKFYSLGIYYFKNEEYKKAIEFFKKALIIDPDHADSKNKMRLLIKKLKNKQNYLSEKYYSIVDGYLIDKKISVIGGNINFKTWFNLGLYYKEMQMYEQAVAAFKNALRIRPNHTDTHFELSSIYDEIANYYEYINIYNEVELYDIDDQINDDNNKENFSKETMPQELNLSELHYKLGWAFGESKYYFEVIVLCKRAINIEPEFVDAFFWIGWVYEKLKQYEVAVSEYKKAINIDKNYIFAYNRLGNIYLKQSEFGEAIELYEESIKNNPENIQAYLKAGSIYNKILQYDKAIEILKKALEIDPQNFFLCHLISKSYIKLGWYGNAKDALKKAIDIKPDYFKGYKTLREVYNNLSVNNGRPLMDVEIINTTKKPGDYLRRRKNMWQFIKLEPGMPERDPHEAEFFRLTNPAEQVVRETVQNSLDAKIEEVGPIRVNFILGNVRKERVRNYLGDLEPHLSACNLLGDTYTSSDRIRFLTIEDYGTTGLDGATAEDWSRPAERSNFYNFWWCEGKSRKSGREAGRWGLGKTTFHLASRLRSFFGLTVRNDDRRTLLMGKSLLKTHRIGADVYHYYGYFTAENYIPISEEGFIRTFMNDFQISRDIEPGLVIVILMPDDEIYFSSMVRAAIINYFYAILKGLLQIEIKEVPDKTLILTADNLIETAFLQNWQDIPWEGIDVRGLLQFIQASINNGNVIEIPQDTINTGITQETFGEEITNLKEQFNRSSLLSFKIPVRIQKKNENPRNSYFHIHIKKSPNVKQAQEIYTRSGITISGIKTLGSRSIYALFVAEEETIAEFLGDCEPPAHTDWNERIEEFKEKYENAVRTLRFIKGSIKQVASLLDQPPAERQVDFLKEIFFVPKNREGKGIDTTSKPIIPGIKRGLALFDFVRVDRGFKVFLKQEDKNIQFPLRRTIKVAYDVRRGNPFSQYEPHDFDLGSNIITIQSTGCSILERSRNQMKIEVAGSDFNLELTGFDFRRDLVVSVYEEKSREAGNETQI